MSYLYAATGTLAAYVLLGIVSPFGRCWHCRGNGSRRSWLRRRVRYCHPCKGTGHRVRLVRRAWSWWKVTTAAREASSAQR